MAISSCSSCSSGSYASQASSIRAQSAQDETRRANQGSNGAQLATNPGANNIPSPTVNTNGQTVGRLINVAA